RGDSSEHDYKVYAQRILGFPISDEKKQKLLDTLYEKWSKLLRYEAQHVSVMVAGPAKYNAKRLDKSEQVLKLSSEVVAWMKGIEEQVKQGTRDTKTDPDWLEERIRFCDERPELDPTAELAEMATIDNARFIRLFEELHPKYKWRKNSNIYKLYLYSKEGKVKEIKREVFYEDANLTAYREGDRAYIRFIMRPKRQLIVALKSRKWWWNSGAEAWSAYLDRVDEEWVRSISERYADYI
ncbi:MAG: hypothetical protein II877_06915, partial [Synergistaceae bacterium]|nr:hypothetical protein [Synergistaceae bacterium]